MTEEEWRRRKLLADYGCELDNLLRRMHTDGIRINVAVDYTEDDYGVEVILMMPPIPQTSVPRLSYWVKAGRNERAKT